MLINRLMDHVLGEVEMTSTQVRAAEALLKKCLPDLKATDTMLTVDGEIGVREVVKQYVGNRKDD